MINRVVLVGRITRNLDLRKTNTGRSVVSFSIACNRRFNQQDYVDFINCVAWEKQAEYLSKYLGKGSLIGLEGRIQSRSYTDRNNRKIYVQEVVIENVRSFEIKKEKNENHLSDDISEIENSLLEKKMHKNKKENIKKFNNKNNKDNNKKKLDDIIDDDLPF